jgi:hypothetical protein
LIIFPRRSFQRKGKRKRKKALPGKRPGMGYPLTLFSVNMLMAA